ncbi:MAG: hypothetical protein ACRDD7_15100 [Peptostreptococcaceae bacterium]
MKKKITWNENKIKKLKRMIMDGMNTLEIANYFDTTMQTVTARVISLTNNDNSFMKYKDQLSDNNINLKEEFRSFEWSEDKDNILKELISKNITFAEIQSRYLKTDLLSIKNRAIQLGIHNISNKKRWTEDEDYEITYMYNNNLSYDEIGKKIGKSGKSVELRLRKIGSISKKNWTKSDDKTLEILYKECSYDESMIANIMNKKPIEINKRLEILNLIDILDETCFRCKEDKSIGGNGKYSKYCKDCGSDMKAIDKMKKESEDAIGKKESIIKTYIKNNYDNLLYCEKCKSKKDPHIDYYYTISHDRWVYKECKKCGIKRTEIKTLKKLEKNGYR